MDLNNMVANKALHEGWYVVKVRDVLKRVRNSVDVKKDSIFREIGIKSHGKGIFYKDEVTGESLGDKSVFWIEPDCFIVNIVFAWELAVAKTTSNEVGMIASHRFPMYKPVKDKLDLDFITNFFKTPYGKYLLNLASPGGAGRNKTLGQEEFLELEIRIPKDVGEQRKITSILSTWDKAIELEERLIEQKKVQKRGLIQKLLTDKCSLTAYKGQWKEAYLDKVVFYQEGPGVRNYQYSDNGVKLINVGNLQKNKLNLSTTNRFITEEEANVKYQHFLVDEGDLIIACSGISSESFAQKIAFAKREHLPLCMNTSTMRFKVLDKSELSIEYLFFYFQSYGFKRQIDNVLTGSAQFNFGPTHIRKLKIRYPVVLDEQIQRVRVLEVIHKEIDLLERKLQMLIQQKKGLEQSLLTGKVKVKC